MTRSASVHERALGNLWTCPKCGRKLVGRNMAHSCSSATVAQFLRRAGARERALYAHFERMIAACGPYHVSPAKTRVAFMARVRFANVNSIGPRGMVVTLALTKPLASPRFEKVEEVVPGWWVHRLRITALGELDRELQTWLRRSYRLMGMQERLRVQPGRARGARARAGTGNGSAGRSRAPSRSRG
ncbi:MAG: hypothetical protein HOP15_11525 [Planctomycetes bacterium]|nr:hypothetical protein [Planctomycetota bacterium]